MADILFSIVKLVVLQPLVRNPVVSARDIGSTRLRPGGGRPGRGITPRTIGVIVEVTWHGSSMQRGLEVTVLAEVSFLKLQCPG